MADLAAPMLALSFGIGKIGCWLNGCCYGMPTTSWLGVIFTNPLSECDLLNQKLWPAQLFNSASGFIAFAILFWIVQKHKHFDGQVFIWYLYLYGSMSFVVEFFRYIPVHAAGLTPNQWTDLIIITLGLIATPILRRRPSIGVPAHEHPATEEQATPEAGEPDA